MGLLSFLYSIPSYATPILGFSLQTERYLEQTGPQIDVYPAGLKTEVGSFLPLHPFSRRGDTSILRHPRVLSTSLKVKARHLEMLSK